MAQLKFKWWDWIPFQRWRILGNVESADEVPTKLPRRGAVAVGDPSDPKWLAFDCACGEHRILLNTDRSRRPFWRVVSSRGRLSIAPSIDYADQTRQCHYFINNGRTDWARQPQ